MEESPSPKAASFPTSTQFWFPSPQPRRALTRRKPSLLSRRKPRRAQRNKSLLPLHYEKKKPGVFKHHHNLCWISSFQYHLGIKFQNNGKEEHTPSVSTQKKPERLPQKPAHRWRPALHAHALGAAFTLWRRHRRSTMASATYLVFEETEKIIITATCKSALK